MEREPISFEIAKYLVAFQDTETAVCDQVARLLADRWRGSSGERSPHSVAGRPSWWWRVRLIDWAWSDAAHELCSSDTLKGLRKFLVGLTNEELCRFVESSLPEPDGIAESA